MCATSSAMWGPPRRLRRDAAELAGLIVGDRLTDLFDRVHHERPVCDDRLVDGLAMPQDEARPAHRLDGEFAARKIKLDEIVLGDVASIDADISRDDVEKHVASLKAVEIEACAWLGINRRHEV